MELNGRHIRSLENAVAFLGSRYGRITVAVIPVSSTNKNRRQATLAAQGSRVRRARELFTKVS